MRTTKRTVGVLLVGVLLAVSACHRKQPPDAPPTATVNPEGSLPAGCAVVATIDRTAFALLGDAANGLLAASGARTATLAGIDFRRDVRFIRYCKMPSAAGAPSKTGSFIALMSGTIPPNALALAAGAPNSLARRENLDGVPVLATERVWLARRGRSGDAGELVMATDRELLRAALFGAPQKYVTTPGSPLSMVMSPSGLRSFIATGEKGEASPLAAVSEVRVDLVPGATGVSARFVVGDDGKARLLAKALAAPIEALVRQVAGEGAPKVAIDVVEHDVLASVGLPSGTLQALAVRMTAARGGHTARR